jgi:hypothetical protein
MLADEADLDAKEQEWFGNVAVFAAGGQMDIDAKLFMLSNLPAGFDQEKFTNLLMFGYALCFGYDAREFWPVSGGALGSGRETEVQHRKATDKGGREYWFGLQEQIQSNLPPTLHFEADERDAEGELVDANLQKTKADALTALRAALPELNSDQILELAADQGLIPHEWATASDEAESTDIETDDTAQVRKQCLEWIEVQQAIERFPDEPIIQYHWPEERVQVLYARGSEAIQKFYQLDNGEGPRALSKQKRFEGRTIQGEMKKIADEVEKAGPMKMPTVIDEQPKLGWLRGELQALKAIITGNKPEPVNLTINNSPQSAPQPSNVEVHNYMDGQSLDAITEQVKAQKLLSDQLLETLAKLQNPVINVASPVVNIPAPVVNVPAPVVQVKADKPDETNAVLKAIRRLSGRKD